MEKVNNILPYHKTPFQDPGSVTPGDLINPQEVTFTFSASESEAVQSGERTPVDHQFECALDDESFSSCNSPMTYEMEAGKHDFIVRLVS